MRRILAVVGITACASLAAIAIGAAASADATYHTARIPLAASGGAPGSGTVLNIHANGPTVYAHEIYLLRGVTPGDYTVTLDLWTSNLTCTGAATLHMSTATVTTNGAGNGMSDVKFTPEQAGPLAGLTVSARWTVTGPSTYTSPCSVVTLDSLG